MLYLFSDKLLKKHYYIKPKHVSIVIIICTKKVETSFLNTYCVFIGQHDRTNCLEEIFRQLKGLRNENDRSNNFQKLNFGIFKAEL